MKKTVLIDGYGAIEYEEGKKTEDAWQPIETAPKDGRPVWVRGNNWGSPTRGIHCCWAWFDGYDWLSSEIGEAGQSRLEHLTNWLPFPEPPR